MSTMVTIPISLWLLASPAVPPQSRRPAPPAHVLGVAIEDGVYFQGQESYRIRTSTATFVYHKEGGAFASLMDRDDVEWIGHRPGGGSAGEFRGIPNFGGFGHPGYEGDKGSVSRIEAQGPKKVTIRSVARDGRWAWRWDFYPEYATCTLLKTDRPYWFLYEGTPGGKLDLEGGYLVLSSGEKRSLSQSWAEDLPGPEWLFFTGASLRRSLFLAKHKDDESPDQYWPMEGNMTVFGFGRQYPCCGKYLQDAPARFSIGIVESQEFDAVSKAVSRAVTRSGG